MSVDEIRGINSISRLVLRKLDALIVLPEVIRVVVMRLALTVVAKESIKSLFGRYTRRTRITQTPLPEVRRIITHVPQPPRNGHRRVGKRELPLRLKTPIATDRRMSRMTPRHKARPGWRAYRRTSIE